MGLHILKVFRKIQLDLFTKALDYRNTHITEVNDFEEFKQVFKIKEVLYQLIGMALLRQKRR
jgi:hypothetical protein